MRRWQITLAAPADGLAAPMARASAVLLLVEV